LLIFDEVITGFRVALGGAQEYFTIKTDLTILGKIIGGGLPVAGFGGKPAIMEYLAPSGPVYQAGTLSGNPVALSAGLTTLNIISKQTNFYPELAQITHTLTQGIRDIAKQENIPLCINQIGSLFGLFFTEKKRISNFQDVMQCNKERFKKFFHQMLSFGIYLAPSPFESGFFSAAHGPQEVQKTLEAVEQAFSTGLI
jgi:glutamate-1-semialdehyde 2,1-aminomutase